MRRLVDIAVALVIGLLVLPVSLAAALAILATMGRPVLFRQARPGLNGRMFTLVKFRTMTAAATPGDTDPKLDAARTPALGRVLRACGVDELPQLWNVLRGEMSLIGPRPTLPDQVARYSAHERGRLVVRPGLTGWAQVNGRNAISWPARIELDLWYIANRSLALDLRILWLTALRVVRPNGVVGTGGVNPGFPGPGHAPGPAITPPRPGRPGHASAAERSA